MTEWVVAMRIAIHDDTEDMQRKQLEVGDTSPEETGPQHITSDLNSINENQRPTDYSSNASPKVMDMEYAGIIDAAPPCDVLRLTPGGVGRDRRGGLRHGGPEAKCAQRL